MEQFAAEGGVTKPILYRTFGDRSGLYQAVCEHAFEHLGAGLDDAMAQLNVPPRQVVANAVDAYLGFIEREANLYRFLTTRTSRASASKQPVVESFVAKVARQVTAVLGQALRALGAEPAVAEPWAVGIVGMVIAAGEWWLERRTLTRSELAAALTELICDGLPGTDAASPTLAALLGRLSAAS